MTDTCTHSFSWTSNAASGLTQPPEWTVSACPLCGTMAQWRDGAWKQSQETVGSIAIGTAERYGEALQQIIAVLGPEVGCGDLKCGGCEWEMGEALRLAKEAFGVA